MVSQTSETVSALERALAEATAVAIERQRSALATREPAEAGRAEYREHVDQLCSRPSPFASGEEAEEFNARARQGLDPNSVLEKAVSESQLRVRWETALCDAEDALRRLGGVPELRDPVDQIAALIRNSRLTSAAGPESIDIDARNSLGDFIKAELAWTRGRQKELETLAPDVTEEEVAPGMREGLQRSLGFFDHLHGYLAKQQQAADRWEAARTRPIQEALILVQALSRDAVDR